ncbi:MAG: sigma-70 family RNA polymerase sigma factor [Planctomycetales bacterium]|nr:sigma-70 family RNA polymerase sigma factor [Planctomycetales bacterium]
MTEPSRIPPSTLFVQLFAKHQSALNAFISSLVATRMDVDDVMQETSLALWRKWEDFDVNRDFLRWACGIAHIEVLRHRRRSATDRLWLNEEVIGLLSVEMIEEAGLFDMRREALAKCIDKLTEADRTVVDLRYQTGMTVDKMAESLGKTSRSVHRTMARIRRLLHTCITAKIRNASGYHA